MKILITGAKGMLGRTLCKTLSTHTLLATDIEEMDITDINAVNKIFDDFRPDAVIHAAAMTAVDDCETKVDLAYQLNAYGSANIAVASNRHQAHLVAISTDYVFSGKENRAYSEFDATGPQTVYGASKLAGEQNIQSMCPRHTIARIAWLYGQGGPSFFHTIAGLLSQSGDPLKVVNDQIGNPTSTDAVATAVAEYLENEIYGVVHSTCSGEATWFDFAIAIKELTKAKREIIPCNSDLYPRPAPRPANSRLDKMVRRLSSLTPMPGWQESLESFMKEYSNDY